MREVVLDIETAPCDKAHWAELVRRVPSLEKIGIDDTPLDWSFGRIVCIGLSIGKPVSERGAAADFLEDKCQELNWAGPDESSILENFWKAIQPGDYAIGHNLMGFDLPYIMGRSVICKVKPSRSFDLRMYSTAYVYDTQQVWSNWGRRKFAKLDTLAAIMGFAGKTGSGAQVAGWSAANEWDKIREYCMDDVRLTRAVYQRMREYGM